MLSPFAGIRSAKFRATFRAIGNEIAISPFGPEVTRVLEITRFEGTCGRRKVGNLHRCRRANVAARTWRNGEHAESRNNIRPGRTRRAHPFPRTSHWSRQSSFFFLSLFPPPPSLSLSFFLPNIILGWPYHPTGLPSWIHATDNEANRASTSPLVRLQHLYDYLPGTDNDPSQLIIVLGW